METYDAGALNKVYEAGQVAIINQWGSLASAAIDPTKTTAEIAADTGFAAAPTIGGGHNSAITLPSMNWL